MSLVPGFRGVLDWGSQGRGACPGVVCGGVLSCMCVSYVCSADGWNHDKGNYLCEVGVLVGVSTRWFSQVAGGLWWEEAAVVPVQLCGRDGQSCSSPGA